MSGSRWVRFDTNYFGNLKIMAVDRDAMLLHLASIAYCGDQTSDGFIPQRAPDHLAKLARLDRRPELAIEQLVEAGLYVRHADGGWHLHDFETINKQALREAVEREREGWNERKARSRSRVASRRDAAVTNGDVTVDVTGRSRGRRDET